MNRAPQSGDFWMDPANSAIPLVKVEWPSAGGERCPCVKVAEQMPNGSVAWHWRAATPEQAAAAGFTVSVEPERMEQGSTPEAPSALGRTSTLRSAADVEAAQAQQIADRILGNADAAGAGRNDQCGACAPLSRNGAEPAAAEAQAIADRILAAQGDDDEESPEAVARRILDS